VVETSGTTSGCDCGATCDWPLPDLVGLRLSLCGLFVADTVGTGGFPLFCSWLWKFFKKVNRGGGILEKTFTGRSMKHPGYSYMYRARGSHVKPDLELIAPEVHKSTTSMRSSLKHSYKYLQVVVMQLDSCPHDHVTFHLTNSLQYTLMLYHYHLPTTPSQRPAQGTLAYFMLRIRVNKKRNKHIQKKMHKIRWIQKESL